MGLSHWSLAEQSKSGYLRLPPGRPVLQNVKARILSNEEVDLPVVLCLYGNHATDIMNKLIKGFLICCFFSGWYTLLLLMLLTDWQLCQSNQICSEIKIYSMM